eukprot:PLAT12668.1.p1 GENE.PLAT12668.1~~PLAT12668.1.p1  ORF type:complete len:452 (-),score=147.06 PLAT12668.1:31-1386(-)
MQRLPSALALLALAQLCTAAAAAADRAAHASSGANGAVGASSPLAPPPAGAAAARAPLPQLETQELTSPPSSSTPPEPPRKPAAAGDGTQHGSKLNEAMLRYKKLADKLAKPARQLVYFTFPLNVPNVLALSTLLLFAALGGLFMWTLGVRPGCRCPLCMHDYRIRAPLGKGGFGSVFLAEHSSSERAVVLKMVAVEDLNDANESQEEAKKLRLLQHKHIVRYKDDFLHSQQQLSGVDPKLSVCIVMEQCDTDLRTIILAAADKRRPLREKQVVTWFAEICSALRYCHRRQIIHRDLKPANIFLVKNRVRLGDFGLCRRIRQKYESRSYTEAGTDCYMPPEMLLGSLQDGFAADIWCLGLLLYELLSLRTMPDYSGVFGVKLIRTPTALDDLLDTVHDCYSMPLRRLCRSMLASDPDKRPTVGELLASPVLSKFTSPEGRRTRRRRGSFTK